MGRPASSQVVPADRTSRRPTQGVVSDGPWRVSAQRGGRRRLRWVHLIETERYTALVRVEADARRASRIPTMRRSWAPECQTMGALPAARAAERGRGAFFACASVLHCFDAQQWQHWLVARFDWELCAHGPAAFCVHRRPRLRSSLCSGTGHRTAARLTRASNRRAAHTRSCMLTACARVACAHIGLCQHALVCGCSGTTSRSACGSTTTR